MVKNPPVNAGDTGSIPGSGRSPEEGKGNPLQDSCLGTVEFHKSRTQLSDLSSLEIIFKLSLFLFSPLNTFLFHEIST